MTKTHKALPKNILLLTSSTVLVFTFAELVLRIALPSPIIWRFPQEQYHYDAEIGHWLESNQHAYTHDKVVSTNTVGIRDKEYGNEASQQVFRILALGDSQTFGNGLSLIDTWPKQLQARLTKLGRDKKVEVLNCGLPGSDTWQHETILNRMLARYQPNAVVLAFYVNDVVKAFRPDLTKHKDDNVLKNRIVYLLKRSVFLLSLRSAWDSVSQWWSPSGGFLDQRMLLRGEISPTIRERWDQVEISLANMKKASDERKTFFGIVLLPRRDQIDGRLPADAFTSRLRVITEQYKIPFVSLLDPLQQAYKIYGKDLFIPWDGHNSKIANRIIAREIAEKVLFLR